MTRSAEDVGRGLASARQARPIRRGERIHVLGAAGAGASAAAILAARAGAVASGCDPGAPSPYTAALDVLGVAIAEGHDPVHVSFNGRIASVDRLAVTKALTAVAPNHPELATARRLGIPLEPWQQVVADAAATRGSRLVGVAGTHGKSTSSGWLLHVLVRAGHDPSGFVGALLPASVVGEPPATARWGGGPIFVVEADEYAGNFDPYRPSVAVLLNAEWDHPDVFADGPAVLSAFEAWVRRAGGPGEPPILVANVGDAGAGAVAGRLADWSGRVVAVALVDVETDGLLDRERVRLARAFGEGSGSQTAGGTADLPWGTAIVGRIGSAGAEGTSLAVAGLEQSRVTRLEVPLLGRHNARNALAVAAAASILGLSADEITDGIGTFAGVGRRLELIGEPGGVAVLDDYAHHPSAIRETIAAVRQRYPTRRLWAVYEPLTYHRTAALQDAFAAVLAAGADRVAIADIWAGRDPDTTVATPEGLAGAIRAAGGVAEATGDPEATAAYLTRAVSPGDVVLVMGGGRSYVIARRLVDLLAG